MNNNTLIQIILNQYGNSQNCVSQIVEATKEITKQEVTILVSESNKRSEDLVKKGLKVFEDMGLQHAVLSLEFFDSYFSVMIHNDHIPTIMEKLQIQNTFENQIGYPIEFSL